ncbi:MAG: aspartate aminotransferase family protein [Myxococcales bacterium]|nr:aspartate aminotransferase family protein [Myxococcales bacterium]MCB9533136.1 aspartate aminotransferase family protein [Myxococcales bacterium]
MTLGSAPPALVAPVGAATHAWIDRLAATECPAITARRSRRRATAGGEDPIVWAEAVGSNVVDVEGNRYVDLSSGFGVAAIGHRHPAVVEAIREQSGRLLHAMGDLFPSREKILLGERLAAIAPGALQHSILGANGSDAIEAAIKTAVIATGRTRVLAFSSGYHGMSLGALGVSGYRDSFRSPFGALASATTLRLPYATCHCCPLGLEPTTCNTRCATLVEHMLASDTFGCEDVAAIVVEPIQARGGCVVPPAGWLRRIAEVARSRGILVIADEIYTGLGRTGDLFASTHEEVVPDLMCVGKALGGGLPISACVGTPDVMERWAEARGEAIHTSTFLGNPLTCSAALAALDVIEREGLAARAARVGARFSTALEQALAGNPRVAAVRGRGLLIGVALRREDGTPEPGGGVRCMHALLAEGYIAAPAGPTGDVLSVTPPMTLPEELIDGAVEAIARVI